MTATEAQHMRELLQLNQIKMAIVVGVSQPMISKLEKQGTDNSKICAVMNVLKNMIEEGHELMIPFLTNTHTLEDLKRVRVELVSREMDTLIMAWAYIK